MELSARLAEQLSLLAVGPAPDESGLVDDLTALASTLDQAVSGYVGLRLTLVRSGFPVRLTALRPAAAEQDVVSSLRVPLPGVSAALEEGGELDVWSSVPGSLVDLAADVGYLLRHAAAGPGRTGTGVVELDARLPRTGTGSGVDGLDELVAVNRAAGVLIGQGHDPGSVLDELRRRAAADGLSPHAWAARLLQEGSGVTP